MNSNKLIFEGPNPDPFTTRPVFGKPVPDYPSKVREVPQQTLVNSVKKEIAHSTKQVAGLLDSLPPKERKRAFDQIPVIGVRSVLEKIYPTTD